MLTIDTEHEPGSVAIVEVDDTTPDVQETAASGQWAIHLTGLTSLRPGNSLAATAP